MTTTDHLRRLLAKATPGPWVLPILTPASASSDFPEPIALMSDAPRWVECGKRGVLICANDAMLICALINAAPALLDVVDAVRREVILRDGDSFQAIAEALAKLDAEVPHA